MATAANPHVLCVFESTVGYGHLRRMSHIANGLARNGMNVHVATGTRCNYADFFDNAIDIIELPAHQITSQEKSFIFDTKGNRQVNVTLSEEDWQQQRVKEISRLADRTKLDAVILEFWPFVRRREFDPLVEALEHHRPMIFSSVRDLTCTTSAENMSAEQMYLDEAPAVKEINNRVDHILIHADPSMLDFSTSFLSYDQIAHKVCYTGYIVDKQSAHTTVRNKNITVSTGSGVRGYPLLAQTLQAMPYTSANDYKWNFVMGPRIGDENERKLHALAETIQSDHGGRFDLSLVRQNPNLRNAFETTSLSISQAGYNTSMEVLASGAPNLFVPDFKQDETGAITHVNEEQSKRLARLKQAGLVAWLDPREIFDLRRFAVELDCARTHQFSRAAFDMNGIENTANFIAEKVRNRKALN